MPVFLSSLLAKVMRNLSPTVEASGVYEYEPDEVETVSAMVVFSILAELGISSWSSNSLTSPSTD